ncbi:unnamed protein product, partial [Choristocarpus tenellus]
RGGLPILGQALKLGKGAPWDVMTSWMHKYGPIYRFSMFGKQCVVLAEPQLMKDVMKTKFTNFHKDVGFTYRPFLSLLGTGIVTSDGLRWRSQRNKVSAAFRIEVLSEIPGMSQRAVARLSEKLDAIKGTSETIEIGEELRHLTLQVISEALMSLTPQESDETFAKVYMPIVVEGHFRVWNPAREFCPLLPAWWAHRRNTIVLNKYITRVIQQRWSLLRQRDLEQQRKACESTDVNHGQGGQGQGQENQEGKGANGSVLRQKRQPDILDKVLGLLEPGEWGPAVVRQIRDEMKTFVLAGHETSASMLNWALYELVENSTLHDKVVQESEDVFGTRVSLSAPLPSVESLRALSFSEACLREALRKYSIVPLVVRKCVEHTTICDKAGKEHAIPKGTVVMLMIK